MWMLKDISKKKLTFDNDDDVKKYLPSIPFHYSSRRYAEILRGKFLSLKDFLRYLYHVIFPLRELWGLSLYFIPDIKMQSPIVCDANSLRIYE